MRKFPVFRDPEKEAAEFEQWLKDGKPKLSTTARPSPPPPSPPTTTRAIPCGRARCTGTCPGCAKPIGDPPHAMMSDAKTCICARCATLYTGVIPADAPTKTEAVPDVVAPPSPSPTPAAEECPNGCGPIDPEVDACEVCGEIKEAPHAPQAPAAPEGTMCGAHGCGRPAVAWFPGRERQLGACAECLAERGFEAPAGEVEEQWTDPPPGNANGRSTRSQTPRFQPPPEKQKSRDAPQGHDPPKPPFGRRKRRVVRSPEEIETARLWREAQAATRAAELEVLADVDPTSDEDGDPPVERLRPEQLPRGAVLKNIVLEKERLSGRGLPGSRLLVRSIYYDGQLRGAAGQRVTIFTVFRRKGYEWRTVGVMLHEDELRDVAAALLSEADRLDREK